MMDSPTRAPGLQTGKGKGPQAANLGGPKKSLSQEPSYPTLNGPSTDPEAQANVTSLPRRWVALRRHAAVRQAELCRLALCRRSYGALVDANLFAWLLAATLGCVAAGPYKVAGRQRFIRWHGLSLESLRLACTRADLGHIGDAELATIIVDVERWQAAHPGSWMSARRLGEFLQLTAAERDLCRIRTADAVDESRAERKARIAANRRARDRERRRAERGRVPREVYQARSISQQKPWQAEGVSRATWYRLKRETSVSTHVLSIQGEQTHLSQPSLIRPSAGPASPHAVQSIPLAGGPTPGGKAKAAMASRTGSAAAAEGGGPMKNLETIGCPSRSKYGAPRPYPVTPGEKPMPPLEGLALQAVPMLERAMELLEAVHRAHPEADDLVTRARDAIEVAVVLIWDWSETRSPGWEEMVCEGARMQTVLLQPVIGASANDNEELVALVRDLEQLAS